MALFSYICLFVSITAVGLILINGIRELLRPMMAAKRKNTEEKLTV